jgi:hypothetical protein
MLINPSVNNTVKFKLDVDGADTLPICRLLIPAISTAGTIQITLDGNIEDGSVSFEIPVLKTFLEKGTKKLGNCTLEAIIDDQYFILNQFDIDLKEDISIKAEISEGAKEESKSKPKFSIDTSNSIVEETVPSLGAMF